MCRYLSSHLDYLMYSKMRFTGIIVAFWCLALCEGNPMRANSSDIPDFPGIFEQPCPTMDCEVLVQHLTCSHEEREVRTFIVNGHECLGCPTCRGAHPVLSETGNPAVEDIQPAPPSSSSTAPLSTTTTIKSSPTQTTTTTEATTTTTTTASTTPASQENEEDKTTITEASPESEKTNPGQAAEIENKTTLAGFPDGEKGHSQSEDQALIKALSILREWSRDGRLGGMLERVLGVPSFPFESSSRYVSRPSMDFPEEVPPVNLGCPTLDCEAIEESLICDEADREPTFLTTTGGMRCEGCRRCSPKVQPARQPVFSHFPFGGCPRLDCNRIEAMLRCPSSRRVQEYFTIPSGKECPGCRTCARSQNPLSMPPPPPPGVVGDRVPAEEPQFPCPVIDCEIVELSLECPEGEKEVEYFESHLARRMCPGCRRCRTYEPEPVESDPQEGERTPGLLPPECPSLDCQIVEEHLACVESEREEAFFDTPHGLRCPGCRSCRVTSHRGDDSPEDVIQPADAPSLGASLDRAFLQPPRTDDRVSNFDGAGERDAAGERAAVADETTMPSLPELQCPEIDCQAIHDDLACSVAERELDHYITQTGQRCQGCMKCKQGPLSSALGVPADHLGLPVVSDSSQCPLTDCSELEDGLPCPPSQRRVVYFETRPGVLCPGCMGCRHRSDEVPPPPPHQQHPTSPLPRGCPLLNCEEQEADLPCADTERRWTTFRISTGQICPSCRRCVR